MKKRIVLFVFLLFTFIAVGYLGIGLLTPPNKVIKSPLVSRLSPTMKIEVDDYVPRSIGNALIYANSGMEVVRTGAKMRLSMSDRPTSLEWVLVPAVPFPTLVDDVTWADISSFWRGSPGALSYLANNKRRPTLFCSPETARVLEMILGKPGSRTPIKIVSSEELVDQVWAARPASWAIVPFDQLTPRLKALRLDGVDVLGRGLAKKDYPLRIYFSLQGEEAGKFVLPHFTNRDERKMTVLLMTGVTALVRMTAWEMERNGVLYPSQKIGPILRSADITHISNEVPFARDCPFPNPNQKTLTFCSNPAYIKLLTDVGADVIELTGNHFEDYGPEATRKTVAMYDQKGWRHYGGGLDLADAQKPLLITDHGNVISFMGCNPVGPAFAWAGENRPGAAPCNFDFVHRTLGRLKKKAAVPIFTWQYEEAYQYQPTSQQRKDFRAMVDAGAKIVSGSQAHQPQAMEFYKNGFIHYGLGNLFFDQMQSLGTRQECVDRHIIYNGRHISTELLTFMLENYAQPRPMTVRERRVLLQSLFEASGW